MVHQEYERYHRYDEPKGAAVKVFNQEDISWPERLSIFFQLGE
ncbi:YqzK family protein [Thalassobacillus devorans]|nr:YqzK family protein [Thalassobacillus devorans]